MADRGGSEPQSASTSASRETTSFVLSRSRASNARCFGPPSATGPFSDRPSTGPRIRNSVVFDPLLKPTPSES